MTYANATERGSLIAGLRALADFLEKSPDVPAPRWTDVMVFPPTRTDREMRAEIDRIAVLTGADVSDMTAQQGHYVASLEFGHVQYKAVGIPVRSRAIRDAQTPHSENIMDSDAGGGRDSECS